METYASFYYIRWKAILKGLTLRQGDCNVKHRGDKKPGDTKSCVNRKQSTSTRHTHYLSNKICKHNALCIKGEIKNRMMKVVLKYCY